METFNDVINSGQLVLVDFFATWCQPCKAMHPILEQVKSVLGDRIRIIKVDVDKYGVTANQYRIQSVPTLMLFRNGEVLWRTSDVVDKAELLATLDPFLKYSMNTLHSCFAYYLLALNAVTFIVYGIDKYKAKKAKWRIPEATLLLLAVLGGSIGAWMGMKIWHHKTMHKKFKYGIPAILLLQIALMAYLHMK